jgi:hypothetical protein
LSAILNSTAASYLDTKDDYEEKYQKYLNKKVSKKGDFCNYAFIKRLLYFYNVSIAA